jgi:hypothetical protein
MIKARTDKELRIIIQEKYEQLVKNRGELFDRLTIPMDETDKAEVKKKQFLVVLVLAPLLLLILSASLYFVWDDSPLSYLFLAFIALVVILTIVSYFHYEHVLKSNSKEIIKGVLTNKQRIDDGDNVEYDFEISNREVISVGRSDFKDFTIGDILEIELLGGQNSLSLKTKVKRTGTILDDKAVD